MTWISMRKLGRLSKSTCRLGLGATIFCAALYLTNLVFPAKVIGSSGEKISQNSSFFILENELNSISLSNETKYNESIFWNLPALRNITEEDLHDIEESEETYQRDINYEKDFHHESNSQYVNGTAGAKYVFGHEYINKQLCPRHGRDAKGIIFIHSFPLNRKKRMAIRRSWGLSAWSKGVIVAFFMGQLERGKTKSLVRGEIEKFGDVVIGNFVERYYELPLKTMSMLEWLNFYCNKVPFIVKSDDDVFINMIHLMSFLEINEGRSPALFGRVLHVEPVRNPRSKYYISKEVYPGYRLPAYAQGFCYILHGELVQDLFYTALNTTYMQFEDLFITGMVAQKLNIPRVKSQLFPNYKHGAPSLCEARKVIGMHKVTADEQFDMQAVAVGEKGCH